MGSGAEDIPEHQLEAVFEIAPLLQPEGGFLTKRQLGLSCTLILGSQFHHLLDLPFGYSLVLM